MPQFKDLGKKASDLFKKQYDYKNEIKVTTKASGVKLESSGNASFAGYTKANWTDDYLGDVEVEAHSGGCAKGKFALKNVTDGVNVTVNGDAAGEIGVEATYVQDSISALASCKHNLNKSCTKISASAVLGFEGVSVGGGVNVDATGNVSDYNCGAEYSTKDLTASLVTSNKGDDITISFYQKVCGGSTLGAAMLVKADATRLYTFGTETSLDKSTGIKAKADSTGTVGVAVSHTLSDPKMKVGVSAQFNAASDDAFKAQKFGVCLNFGEF